MTKCPICKNTYGFAVGMCCNCGYNHISHKFERIEVYVEDLKLMGIDNNNIEDLIDMHYDNYKKEN